MQTLVKAAMFDFESLLSTSEEDVISQYESSTDVFCAILQKTDDNKLEVKHVYDAASNLMTRVNYFLFESASNETLVKQLPDARKYLLDSIDESIRDNCYLYAHIKISSTYYIVRGSVPEFLNKVYLIARYQELKAEEKDLTSHIEVIKTHEIKTGKRGTALPDVPSIA